MLFPSSCSRPFIAERRPKYPAPDKHRNSMSLLCEWGHSSQAKEGHAPPEYDVKAEIDAVTSLSNPSAKNLDKPPSVDAASKLEPLLCGWKYPAMPKEKKNITTQQPPATRLENEPAQLEPLLCGWNHPVIPKEAEGKQQQSPVIRSASDGQLLCGWKHDIATTGGINNNINAYRNGSRIHGDRDPQESAIDNASLLSLASTRKSMHQQRRKPRHRSQNMRGSSSFHGSSATSAPSRPQNNARWGSDGRFVSPLPTSANSLWGVTDYSRNNTDNDGAVLTYLGKEYSARDVIERSSQRSLRSNHSQRSLLSLDDDDDDSDDEFASAPPASSPTKEVTRIPGLMRSLSNLSIIGGSSSSLDLTQKKSPQLSQSEEYKSLHLTHGRSQSHSSDNRNKNTNATAVETDDHIDKLQVRERDLQKIADDPVDFAALKKMLKSNGAVTNGLLQQGLHVFVQQHREKKLREQEFLKQGKNRHGKRQKSRRRIQAPIRRQQSMPTPVITAAWE